MKCTSEEWNNCRVEKMGCIGCYYDEIEPDEYVRTDKGYIFKVDQEKKILQGLKFLDMQYGYIVSHSKKREDLIKTKDILMYKINHLSSYKIGEVRRYKDARSGKEYLGVEGFGLDQIKILKIMTKEGFENNSYEWEE